MLEWHIIIIISIDRFYQVYSGTNQNYKVARLEENTKYHLRICASNEAGTGPFSPITSLSTTKAPPPLIKGRKVLSISLMPYFFMIVMAEDPLSLSVNISLFFIQVSGHCS